MIYLLNHRLQLNGNKVWLKYFICISIIVFNTQCATHKYLLVKQVPNTQFLLLTWQEQVRYFNDRWQKPFNTNDIENYKQGLQSKYNNVVISTIEYALRVNYYEHESLYSQLLKHKQDSIRAKTLDFYIHLLNEDFLKPEEVLDKVAPLRYDPSWVCREKVFRIIRFVDSEQEKQKYYNSILLLLNQEQNTTVIKELINTLMWYKNPSTYPVLYKRSFTCKSDLMLIIFLNALSKYVNKDSYYRLKDTAKNHPTYIVRQEALKLLTE